MSNMFFLIEYMLSTSTVFQRNKSILCQSLSQITLFLWISTFYYQISRYRFFYWEKIHLFTWWLCLLFIDWCLEWLVGRYDPIIFVDRMKKWPSVEELRYLFTKYWHTYNDFSFHIYNRIPKVLFSQDGWQD